jgi:hypothetical protein
MLDGPKSGHFVRETVANPAFLARTSVENFDSQTGVFVMEVARLVNQRESAARNNPAQAIAP